MVFVGGADFGEVEHLLWLFAILGTVLAMLQLQVYAVLARQGRRAVLLVWGALGGARRRWACGPSRWPGSSPWPSPSTPHSWRC